MSATGRGNGKTERQPDDFYETPAWCVHRLLEACRLPEGRWMEPCAGEGAIIRAVNDVRSDVRWWAIEKRQECQRALASTPLVGQVAIRDFLAAPAVERPPDGPLVQVVITNPSFRLAQEIIEAALPLGRFVVMLLRLNYLASGGRADFMRSNIPDWYVLPNRPSFIEVTRAVWKCVRPRKRCRWSCLRPIEDETVPRCQKCGALCERKGTRTTTSDATEYAWAVWPPERGRRQGKIQVLEPTPEEIRLVARQARRAA